MWQTFFRIANFLPPAAAYATVGADSTSFTVGLNHPKQTPAALIKSFRGCLLVSNIGWKWLGYLLSEQGAKGFYRSHNDCGTGFKVELEGAPGKIG